MLIWPLIVAVLVTAITYGIVRFLSWAWPPSDFVQKSVKTLDCQYHGNPSNLKPEKVMLEQLASEAGWTDSICLCDPQMLRPDKLLPRRLVAELKLRS